jgi:hypothetical protein
VTALTALDLLTEPTEKGYNDAIVAYKKTMPWWQSIHPENIDKHPAATAAKHPPAKTK